MLVLRRDRCEYYRHSYCSSNWSFKGLSLCGSTRQSSKAVGVMTHRGKNSRLCRALTPCTVPQAVVPDMRGSLSTQPNGCPDRGTGKRAVYGQKDLK